MRLEERPGPMVEDGWIYIEIRKGMYGLPLAGLLANLKPSAAAAAVWQKAFDPPILWGNVALSCAPVLSYYTRKNDGCKLRVCDNICFCPHD